MSLVKIKGKYQVTLPARLRAEAGLEIGDLLEVKNEGKKITLTPQSLVDRDIEISLRQYREGKVSPAFSSARDLIRHLHREARKLKKSK
ncbi:hypothetical protein A3H65_03455 [Candidatus Giovannonibacteria bacterium RIFCSPLOWO2_02_FULL_45_14]|uniref:SpoVT-AbrB domain-containing protein n=1 Tax=Candidatus Giovannonibacteria bacterium RIFCSPLOWO2_12_FULL_44_15 TaxID=1798364 RepID=A0A1F5Y153_9BACT|nr:MAG: hypothetical protein A3C75_01760 [Candidatus Giovannonibacteria bacterium RIFCSPHIGHO2_02_FULL_44_31]OGF77146.1 MAG: hypothetical protein A3E62_00160 [Candidatus Giovannonibacteria bacterium RIFCSPHIGHO2_12_FULL_44_29]OGF90693.1 MAG: hypothetical protein A3H65_03455 [Candidatus Giovannonibacteria bacterium RIFCSPLOWO2_02_FULL_45_14]OGF93551.1 MAG: hypothetical protein A3G54_01240 [Candidatus Giovannonibacteria bacterium RIFCSPLOWO2_12_FULL_44_15]